MAGTGRGYESTRSAVLTAALALLVAAAAVGVASSDRLPVCGVSPRDLKLEPGDEHGPRGDAAPSPLRAPQAPSQS